MLDDFNRQIEYARISLTDRCNYRCIYCMPECGIEKKSHSDIISLEDTYKIILALKELGIKKFRFTGGEPLVRKGAVDLINTVSKMDGITTYITTNGVMLSSFANCLASNGLSGVNISIDTLSADKYKQVTGGGKLIDALNGLNSAKEAGIKDIKVNAVLMKDFNDDEIELFATFGKDNNVRVRYIELMPFAYGNAYKTYGLSADSVISKYNLIKKETTEFTNNAEYYVFPNGNEVGFIRPLSNKFCSKCNRIRITSDGKLLLCLHKQIEVDLKDSLNDFDKLVETIKKGIMLKPAGHELCEGNLQERPMNSIGG